MANNIIWGSDVKHENSLAFCVICDVFQLLLSSHPAQQISENFIWWVIAWNLNFWPIENFKFHIGYLIAIEIEYRQMISLECENEILHNQIVTKHTFSSWCKTVWWQVDKGRTCYNMLIDIPYFIPNFMSWEGEHMLRWRSFINYVTLMTQMKLIMWLKGVTKCLSSASSPILLSGQENSCPRLSFILFLLRRKWCGVRSWNGKNYYHQGETFFCVCECKLLGKWKHLLS